MIKTLRAELLAELLVVDLAVHLGLNLAVSLVTMMVETKVVSWGKWKELQAVGYLVVVME